MAEYCDAHVQTFITNDPKDLKERFRFSFQACLILPEHSCDEALWTARKIGGVSLQQIEKKIQEYCEQEQRICDSLASLYEEKGRHKEALQIASTVYKKNGSGPYADLEFKYGDKKKAYQAMLETCEKNNDECQFIFRYYPNHPQRKKIIENSEKSCRNTGENRSGASVCIDLGIYYFDRGEKAKGLEFLDIDCKKNNSTACEILIALEDAIEKKDQAFKKFCSALALNKVTFSQPINKFCKEEKLERINEEVIQSCKKTVDSWRREIKSTDLK